MGLKWNWIVEKVFFRNYLHGFDRFLVVSLLMIEYVHLSKVIARHEIGPEMIQI